MTTLALNHEAALTFLAYDGHCTNLAEPQETLCVMTQGVVNQDLADSIRRAAVERGVKIYLLIPPDLVQQPASFVPALSSLDGVYVRLIRHNEDFWIADTTTVSTSDLQTLSVDTTLLYTYFLEQWEQGSDYHFAAIGPD